jgi:hypothetical protein
MAQNDKHAIIFTEELEKYLDCLRVSIWKQDPWGYDCTVTFVCCGTLYVTSTKGHLFVDRSLKWNITNHLTINAVTSSWLLGLVLPI